MVFSQSEASATSRRARRALPLVALLLGLAPARPARAQTITRVALSTATAPAAFRTADAPPAAHAPPAANAPLSPAFARAAPGFGADLARTLGLSAPTSAEGAGYRFQVGAGFGGRAGYVIASRLYLGATYAARGSPVVWGLEAPAEQARERLAYVGPEIGFDLRSGPLSFRPYVAAGLGVALAREPGPGGGGPRAGGVVAWPGLSLSYSFHQLSVGADLRPAGALVRGGHPEVCAFGALGIRL